MSASGLHFVGKGWPCLALPLHQVSQPLHDCEDMVYVNSRKFACEPCIKGHRSSSCTHSDRPLFEVKKKGRPVSQCEKCRDLRKSKRMHIKCVCAPGTCEDSTDLVASSPTEVIPPGPKKRRLPAHPTLPNGLKDLWTEPSPTTLQHPKQCVTSLLNPCQCKSVLDCCCTNRTLELCPKTSQLATSTISGPSYSYSSLISSTSDRPSINSQDQNSTVSILPPIQPNAQSLGKIVLPPIHLLVGERLHSPTPFKASCCSQDPQPTTEPKPISGSAMLSISADRTIPYRRRRSPPRNSDSTENSKTIKPSQSSDKNPSNKKKPRATFEQGSNIRPALGLSVLKVQNCCAGACQCRGGRCSCAQGCDGSCRLNSRPGSSGNKTATKAGQAEGAARADTPAGAQSSCCK